jgi:hypothetical protein
LKDKEPAPKATMALTEIWTPAAQPVIDALAKNSVLTFYKNDIFYI